MLLEQPVTNVLFQPVCGQARQFGSVGDFYFIVDFVYDGDF